MLTFTWYDPDHVLVPFNLGETGAPEGIGVLVGVRGLEMPPFSLESEKVPLQAGERFRRLNTQVRDVDLPLHVRSTTTVGLRNTLRYLRHVLNPERGQGILSVAAQDGAVRNLHCRFVGPWLGDLSATGSGETWTDILVTFRALDPYFYDTNLQAAEFQVGGTIATFLSTAAGDPFLPMHLTGSNVLQQQTTTNPGDVPAWPVWTVHGPGASVTVRRLSPAPQTVLEVDFPTALTSEQTVVIDTRPGYKTVTQLPSGGNLFGAINATSREFWTLPHGPSLIQAEMTGAGVGSSVHMEYTPAYLGI